jgi:hypothetical protein
MVTLQSVAKLLDGLQADLGDDFRKPNHSFSYALLRGPQSRPTQGHITHTHNPHDPHDPKIQPCFQTASPGEPPFPLFPHCRALNATRQKTCENFRHVSVCDVTTQLHNGKQG